MLLIAIVFVIIMFINMHLQSNCEYIINNVNILIKTNYIIAKRKLIIKSLRNACKKYVTKKGKVKKKPI